MGFLEERRKKGKCATDLMEPTNPTLEAEAEVWRCSHCKELQYNLDSDGYPAPGALFKKWGGPNYPQLCNLCFGMLSVLNTGLYWTNLHTAWKEGFKG